MSSRKWIGLALLSLVASNVHAQSSHSAYDQTGLEMGLTERKGDPFVFCRYGMKDGKAWFTMPPYTTPMVTPGYCLVPTPNCGPYLIGWSADEIRAWGEYVAVCPGRGSPAYGDWDGENGSAESAPISH